MVTKRKKSLSLRRPHIRLSFWVKSIVSVAILLILSLIGFQFFIINHYDEATIPKQQSRNSHHNRVKNGYLLIYSDKGVYDRAKVSYEGVNDSGDRRCGEFNSPRLLSRSRPLRLACSPIGSNESYQVEFAKNNKLIRSASCRLMRIINVR
jgi:hypothetical protein